MMASRASTIRRDNTITAFIGQLHLYYMNVFTCHCVYVLGCLEKLLGAQHRCDLALLERQTHLTI